MYYNKFQQGGEAEAQQQFITWLAQVFDIENEEQLQQLAQKLGQQGIVQMQQIFQQYPDPKQAKQVVKQMISQQAQIARRGAILNYYKDVMKICGPNERAIFYNKGGRICKSCEEKQNGGTIDENKISNPSQNINQNNSTTGFNGFKKPIINNMFYNSKNKNLSEKDNQFLHNFKKYSSRINTNQIETLKQKLFKNSKQNNF